MYFVRLWGHKLENNVVQGSAAGAQIVARLGSQGCWRLSDQNLLAELRTYGLQYSHYGLHIKIRLNK